MHTHVRRRAAAAAAALLLPAHLAAQAPLPATQLPPGPLSLVQAVDLGRRFGVQAALARITARAADARAGQRRADLLPFIAGTASYTRQTLNLDELGLSIPLPKPVTDPFDLWRLQLRGAQTLFDAAALTRYASARDSVIAAGLDAQAAGNLAGATAGIAYLRLLSAQFTVRAREADSAVAARLLEDARAMTDAGVAPIIDQTRNEVNLAAVRGQLVVARNQRDRARLDLLRALNAPLASEVSVPETVGDPVPAELPTDPDSATAFALEHRPELAAERERTRLARNAERAIKYENLPSLGVTGYVQESGRDPLRGSWNVQVGVQVPILDGLRRQTRAQEQAVRVEAQQVREQDLVQQIEQEARQAVLDLASARTQVEVARERLRLAEQELAQAEERFRAGVAGSVETTQAQAGLTLARDALIQAGVAYGTARVSAYRALGILDQLK